MKRYEMVYEGGHNGELVEAEAGGDWVRYEDVAELQRQLDAARREIRELQESELKLAIALRDTLNATIDKTLERLSK